MESIEITRSDWPHFKREALFALAAAALGLALIGASHHIYRTAEQTFLEAAATQQASQATLASLETERTELETSLPIYQSLTKRTIIGSEDRLNWHEVIEAEHHRQALEKVAFSLAPRHPIQAEEAGNPVAPGLLRPYRSTMKLSAEFQQETAFVDFLEQVAEQAHALIIIRACRIDRVGAAESSDTWHLAAECTIDWATLEKSPLAAAEPPP